MLPWGGVGKLERENQKETNCILARNQTVVGRQAGSKIIMQLASQSLNGMNVVGMTSIRRLSVLAQRSVGRGQTDIQTTLFGRQKRPSLAPSLNAQAMNRQFQR